MNFVHIHHMHVGKFGLGKIGKFGEQNHSPIFYLPILSVVATHAAHSLILYPPIGSG